MLSIVTLDDGTGTAVTLHQDTPTGKRWLTEAHGLRGVQSLRMDKRVRSQAHGGINQTRYEDGRQITLVGEIMSNVSIEDAFNEWSAIAAPLVQTLDNGPALLKWTEGGGPTNYVLNPSFEYDVAGSGPAVWSTAAPGTLVAGATITATSAQAKFGAQSMQVVTTAAQANEGACGTLGEIPSESFIAGVTYCASVWVRGSVGGERVDVVLGNDVDNAVLASNLALTTGWQQVTGTWTPVTASFINAPRLVVRTHSAAVATFFVDAAIVQRGVGVAAYVDGDSPGNSWISSPGSSASYALGGHPLQRLVKLDGDLDPPMTDGQAVLTYQALLFAEDPRAYSQIQQFVTSSPVTIQGGGHTFNTTYPRTYASSGGGTVSFTNSGNRPTPPVFRILGDCVNPQIVLLGTGLKLCFIGEVPAGTYLEVDVAKRTVKLAGTTSRLNFYDGANSTWFELPGVSASNPTGTSNLQLVVASSSDGNAALEVIGRSAFA